MTVNVGKIRQQPSVMSFCQPWLGLRTYGQVQVENIKVSIKVRVKVITRVKVTAFVKVLCL